MVIIISFGDRFSTFYLLFLLFFPLKLFFETWSNDHLRIMELMWRAPGPREGTTIITTRMECFSPVFKANIRILKYVSYIFRGKSTISSKNHLIPKENLNAIVCVENL